LLNKTHADITLKGNATPSQACEFPEFENLRFQDNRHMNLVWLSALRTGRLYHLGNIPGTHFC